MKYWLLALSCIFSTLAVSVHASPFPSGPYLNYCTAINWNEAALILTASCRNAKGIAHQTSISNATYDMLNGRVDSKNGNLTAPNITPGGSWTSSCEGSSYNQQNHLLTASCAMNTGAMLKSSIAAYAAQSVRNNNGILQYG